MTRFLARRLLIIPAILLLVSFLGFSAPQRTFLP